MQIRRMTDSDLPSANELRRLAGWNQTEEDWRRLLTIAPGGCFVAVQGEQVVGTVTTTPYGLELAWVGMMLVHPDHRRKGLATRLMNRALEHLATSEVRCVKLDATPAGRPLYQRLGFRQEISLTRWQREAGGRRGAHPNGQRTTRAVVAGDWPEIERIDAGGFGIHRGSLLKTFAREAVASLVWPKHGRLLSWGLLRAGTHSDYLGPLQGSADGISALVDDLLAQTGNRTVVWDIPDERGEAIEAAKRRGFRPLRPLTRMRLGSALPVRDGETFFGIVDPAVG